MKSFGKWMFASPHKMIVDDDGKPELEARAIEKLRQSSKQRLLEAFSELS